jgi:fructuronate reductase
MELTEKGIRQRRIWQEKGYALPAYDRAAMIQETRTAPVWVHFGAGNIFRAFQANVMQRMLTKGRIQSGLIAVDGYDYEIITKQYRPHDNLSILVTLKADGSVEKSVIGSIGESCILDRENKEEFRRMLEIFRAPSLQMASFTITEKGYALKDSQGNLLPAVAADFAAGPAAAQGYLGKVASLLYARYQADQLPLAMVSMDNCSRNGEKLFTAMDAFARQWTQRGLADQGFAAYVEDAGKVSFPWTMIDKITPRPDPAVSAMLEKDGLDLTPVITSKNTYVAPFVNSEESEYLVVEDAFPNGRPALEEGGLIFTDRETVQKVERMKVSTCLNPLHTALAVYGCLLGYTRIAQEMKDADLVRLVKTVGYTEGLPVVTDPGILDPRKFIDTVVNKRLVNPFLPDTPQRIATDTSQKLGVRFGETVKAYMADPARSVLDLKAIPLVYAGWLRYLLGVDDAGSEMPLSSDPLLASLQKQLETLRLGEQDEQKIRAAVLPILKNKQIFAVDLEEAGLADRVVSDLQALLKGPGAVRETLDKTL